MTTALCLSRDRWILVALADGGTRTIGVADLPDLHAEELRAGPARLAWGRGDLRIATLELLIGLLAVALPQRAPREHARLLREPPDGATLAEALAPLHPFTTLDPAEDGPRFGQDRAALDGDLSLDELLIDGPGANTVKQRKDLFVKGGRMTVLSRPAAAILLHAQQNFALSGGPGHRTSMRGGGPLTTLAVPRPQGRAPTLWERAWANLPVGEGWAPPADLSLVFPWAAPTWTSGGDRMVPPEPEGRADRPRAHRLQAFFGMPSRIRLRFAPGEGRPCALTGIRDETVATGFAKVKHGVRYDPAWRHPLTPYYRDKKGQMLPVHPRSTRFGHRDWAGLVLGGPDVEPARALAAARAARWMEGATVLCAGYVTDSATASDWLEAEVPAFAEPDEEKRRVLADEAALLVKGEDGAETRLRTALRRALDADGRATPPPEPMAALRSATAAAFETALVAVAGTAPEDVDGRAALRRDWTAVLHAAALAAFDRAFPASAILLRNPAAQGRIARARHDLDRALRGHGKAGAAQFKLMELAPPQPAKEPR